MTRHVPTRGDGMISGTSHVCSGNQWTREQLETRARAFFEGFEGEVAELGSLYDSLMKSLLVNLLPAGNA